MISFRPRHLLKPKEPYKFIGLGDIHGPVAISAQMPDPPEVKAGYRWRWRRELRFGGPLAWRLWSGRSKGAIIRQYKLAPIWVSMWLQLMWLQLENVRGPVGVVTGPKSTTNDPDRTSDNLFESCTFSSRSRKGATFKPCNDRPVSFPRAPGAARSPQTQDFR